jgi:hypothetical protein
MLVVEAIGARIAGVRIEAWRPHLRRDFDEADGCTLSYF